MIKKVFPELLDREYNGHIDLGEHVCYINTDCNDSEMTPPCSSWVVYVVAPRHHPSRKFRNGIDQKNSTGLSGFEQRAS